LFGGLRTRWRQLKAGEPGTRFQGQYRANRESRKSPWARVLAVMPGLALILVGFIGLFVPGPGMLGIALGAALLARQSRAVARGLAWLELRGRRLARRIRR
jgi:hypothetical protein